VFVVMESMVFVVGQKFPENLALQSLYILNLCIYMYICTYLNLCIYMYICTYTFTCIYTHNTSVFTSSPEVMEGMVSVVGYLAVSLVLHANVVALEGVLY